MLRAFAVALALVAIPAVALADVPPGMSYDAMLMAGHKLYVGGDAKGALEKYEAAKDAAGGRAEAYYYIGAAKAKLEEYTDAISALNTAATISGSKDVVLHAKALFAIAVVQERSGNLDAAYDAWKTVLDYAEAHADAKSFPESARSRIAAIEKRRELEKEGAAIRSRADNKGDQG
jgi:tetratricopeptide (TPR) repeat protein